MLKFRLSYLLLFFRSGLSNLLNYFLPRSEGVCTKMDTGTGQPIQIFKRKYKKEHKVSRSQNLVLKVLGRATFVDLRPSQTRLTAYTQNVLQHSKLFDFTRKSLKFKGGWVCIIWILFLLSGPSGRCMKHCFMGTVYVGKRNKHCPLLG